MIRLTMVLGILISICGCKTDKASENQVATQQIVDVETKSKSSETHQMYLVTVNNLRVREGQSKKSKVVDKLPEGSIVYSRGEVSDKKEKINLRGKAYNEPYRKISYKDKQGWTYGGGLYKIYDKGEEHSFTDEFDNMVLRLDYDKVSGLAKAQDVMSVLRKGDTGSTEWNDLLYILAEQQLNEVLQDKSFYDTLSNVQLSRYEYGKATDLSYPMDSTTFSRSYAAGGFKFDASEGMLGTVLDPVAIQRAIGGPFSDEMSEYLRIVTRASKVKMFSDAAVVAPLSSIVTQVIMIEDFLEMYAQFPRVDFLKEELDYLHAVVLNGTTNTPAISYQSNKVEPEWLIGWNKYIAERPDGLIADKVSSKIKKHS